MLQFRYLPLTIFIFYFAVIPALASDCTAPVLLYTLKSANADGSSNDFGISVARLGDINGDGKPDFIVGAPDNSPDGIGWAGSAFVYSGADGSLLYQVNGTDRANHLGTSVAGLGDINGDGIPDFAASAPGDMFHPAYVAVYSGADGTLLFKIGNLLRASYPFFPVAGVGDVNGDGRPDFAVGIPDASPNNLGSAGSVYVYSGSDGSFLYEIDGIASRDGLGFSIAAMGDISGDGKVDLLIGAPFADTSLLNRYSNGRVAIYSGADKSVIQEHFGANPFDYLGWSVAVIGDVNKDGKTDFIAGAPFMSNNGDTLRPSYARVFSGASGDILFEMKSRPTDELGISVSGLTDADGDGTPDFIIGAPGGIDFRTDQATLYGAAYVYSGANGALIYQVKSPREMDFMGRSVADAGDLNGDGKTDIILGAPTLLNDSLAAVYVFVSKTVPKGDLNADSMLTMADVAELLNVVFVDNTLAISPCTADVNCDGALTPADLILLLNRVFLQTPLPCQ